MLAPEQFTIPLGAAVHPVSLANAQYVIGHVRQSVGRGSGAQVPRRVLALTHRIPRTSCTNCPHLLPSWSFATPSRRGARRADVTLGGKRASEDWRKRETPLVSMVGRVRLEGAIRVARKTRTRRAFGAIRKLPSGRFQAKYLGPDGNYIASPVTYEVKADRGTSTQKHFTDPLPRGLEEPHRSESGTRNSLPT